MDPQKRRALQRMTVELCQHMNPDDMKRVLFSKQMLTPDELERVDLPTHTTRDKNMFILQRIPTKGMRAFDLFIDSLQETSASNPVHGDLVQQLLREVNNS